MERRELERQIVEKEWLMFQQVQDVVHLIHIALLEMIRNAQLIAVRLAD